MLEPETTTTPPKWASYETVEKLYGMSRTTAWRLLKAGEIRAAKVGRSVYVDCQSVEEYLERRAEEREAG